MKKDVFIKIKGVQHADGTDDVTELVTQGNFYRRNNNYYVTYDESEATGFGGSKTTLKVEGGRKVTLGQYGTQHGDVLIGVNAHKVESRLNDEGGDLYFSYSLDINTSLISENEVFISINAHPDVSSMLSLAEEEKTTV